MQSNINEDLISIVNDKSTKKVLATISEKGELNVVFKEMIFINDEMKLFLLEMFEHSKTNKNLVYCIWFNKHVAINILSSDNRSFQLKAVPIRAIVAGKEFEKYYNMLQNIKEDFYLSTVWFFDIIEVIENTLEKKLEYERNMYPFIRHLDQIIKNEKE